jgi:hypothetical protein
MMNERMHKRQQHHMLHIHFVVFFDIDVLVEMTNIEDHRVMDENNHVNENIYYNKYLIDQHRKNLEYNFRI